MNQPTNYLQMLGQFHEGAEYIVVRAPGRINLIGEHTDYNGGLAMPAAIDRYVYVSVSKRSDRRIRMRAEAFGGVEMGISDIAPAPGKWYTYIMGVLAVLSEKGFQPDGFDFTVNGDIPIGAGLSSSAALCCGTVMAIDALFGLGLDRVEMALIAQKAEHTFAGVQCGLMDQYACIFAKRGYAMKLDFLSMQWEYVRLNLRETNLVLLDTGVKHSLATTEYNLRREETSAALELVRQDFPEVTSLREATMPMLFSSVLIPHPVAFKRARFLLEENNRVETVANALPYFRFPIIGNCLRESHSGLSTMYEVSCKELDLLYELATAEKTFIGSRMMGGGFGGCTLNLVEKKDEGAIERIRLAYEASTGIPLKTYRLITTGGARVLERREIRKVFLPAERVSNHKINHQTTTVQLK